MIIVTGAAGFIGSCLVQKLNEEGHTRNIYVVDDFYKDYKDPNLDNKKIRDWIHRDLFLSWFDRVKNSIDFVFHLGARTDTAEKNAAVFEHLNFEYSKKVWQKCTEHNIPLLYASSAATYGAGENGFDDNHKLLSKLKPLNEYAVSKHKFDRWALKQKDTPPKWIGLKFFNVYGPNEYHKKNMASVMYHFYHQLISGNSVRLFKSHREDIKNGEQSRDFIYVMDVLDVCIRFMNHDNVENGIYNLGTGVARTYRDLAKCMINGVNKRARIKYIDTPEEIRDNYQYYSCAETEKLFKAIGTLDFINLEEGISDYLNQFLLKGVRY